MSSNQAKAPLGKLCELINGNGFRPPDWSGEGLPIIRIQNLNGSREFNFFAGEPKNKWIVQPGDILFAWAGVKGVSFGPTIWNGPRGVLNQHIFRVVPNQGVDPYWLYAVLKLVTIQIEAKAHGFKASLLHVQRGEIVDQIVTVPSLKEQRAIAAIIRTWDDALLTSEKLLQCLRRRFQALQNRVFASSLIDHRPWRTSPLNQLVDRIRRKSDNGDHPVMTISGKSGFLRQDDKYSRFMAGESLENYTLLMNGEFAYNKGNSITYPQGCVYRLEQDTALVPHVYISFALHQGLNAEFYAALFQSGFLNRQLARLIKSGVRNNGLLNIGVEEFLSCEFPIPPISEQARIAEIVATAKREVILLESQIERLKQQKSGLMQKLLTGECRVATHDEEAVAPARLAEEAAQ